MSDCQPADSPAALKASRAGTGGRLASPHRVPHLPTPRGCRRVGTVVQVVGLGWASDHVVVTRAACGSPGCCCMVIASL